MEIGFINAITEITLVIFTTLGPAGVVAFILLWPLTVWGQLSTQDSKRLGKYLIIPIAMVAFGIIASATHLGNSSNALYVFSGIGRSPLSNEVSSGVLFLLLAAITWTLFFPLQDAKRVRMGVMFASTLAGLLFLLTVSLAYNVSTIVTWSSLYVPINQWLLGFLL